MTQGPSIDGVLLQWGDRLFYPANRIVRTRPQPKLSGLAARQRVAAIRERIEAAVVRRAPQVIVRMTGCGRGMWAISEHFRYISRNGRLDIEDDRGEVLRGEDSLKGLADDWRYGGTLIDGTSDRREAFNIVLSMLRGTDPLTVLRAAREFAQVELPDHKYVMVLHDHQANPHVHLSVRAESRHGKRLNPRKADLHRWRETFAEKLRGYGVDAEATWQATRGSNWVHEPIWRFKARGDGRPRTDQAFIKHGVRGKAARGEAVEAWMHISQALARSDDAADVRLAGAIDRFVRDMAPERAANAPGRMSDRTRPERSIDRGYER